ncbi:MAG: pitrilysin family protein, partial [Bacteroidota bacterium]
MKPIPRLIIFLALLFLSLPTEAQKAKIYKDLKYPPLHELKIPEPGRFELANGMVLYLLEDHELPVINASALIRAGSRWEPNDKVGLASIAGTVMRTGGTVSKTGDELDEELEKIAASVETSIGQTSGSASMSAMKEDVDKVLAIYADVLMHPAFREDKIDLAKIERRDGIARRNDNVFSIISREFTKLIYGATSPYGRVMEYEHVDNITKDDLVAFHKRFFVPNNVILGLWGDFNAAEMKAKVENVFRDWQRSEIQVPPVPDVRYDFKNRIFFVQKGDINQTNVRIGHIGGKVNEPDYYALDVMNHVLGGGFSSRLF